MFGFNLNANSISAFTSQLVGQQAALPPGLNSAAGEFTGLPSAIGNFAAQAALVRLANQLLEGQHFNRLSSLLDPHQNLALDPKQMATVIKETLNLPQDFESALQLLAETKSDQTAKQANADTNATLQKLAKDIPVETIQQLLEGNGKQAQKQLMKMLQSGDPTIANHGSQMTKLISTLGAMNDSLLLTTNKPVETLILLYLPWYPLTGDRQLEVELGSGSNGESAQEAEKAITLYLRTATLGHFRVQLSELDNEIDIRVWHEDIAKPYCPHLKQSLMTEGKRKGVSKLVFASKSVLGDKSKRVFEPVISETIEDIAPGKDAQNFKGATRQTDPKQIRIQASKSVSSSLLHLAFFTAKTIFESDESGRVLQKRSKMTQPRSTAKRSTPNM